MENSMTLLRLLQPQNLPSKLFERLEFGSSLAKMGEHAVIILIAVIKFAKSNPLSQLFVRTGPVAALIRILQVEGTLPVGLSVRKVFKVTLLNFFIAGGLRNPQPLMKLNVGFEKLNTHEIVTLFCLVVMTITPSLKAEIKNLQLDQYTF